MAPRTKKHRFYGRGFSVKAPALTKPTLKIVGGVEPTAIKLVATNLVSPSPVSNPPILDAGGVITHSSVPMFGAGMTTPSPIASLPAIKIKAAPLPQNVQFYGGNHFVVPEIGSPSFVRGSHG